MFGALAISNIKIEDSSPPESSIPYFLLFQFKANPSCLCPTNL